MRCGGVSRREPQASGAKSRRARRGTGVDRIWAGLASRPPTDVDASDHPPPRQPGVPWLAMGKPSDHRRWRLVTRWREALHRMPAEQTPHRMRPFSLLAQSGRMPLAVETLACGQRATAHRSTRSCSRLIDGGRCTRGLSSDDHPRWRALPVGQPTSVRTWRRVAANASRIALSVEPAVVAGEDDRLGSESLRYGQRGAVGNVPSDSAPPATTIRVEAPRKESKSGS